MRSFEYTIKCINYREYLSSVFNKIRILKSYLSSGTEANIYNIQFKCAIYNSKLNYSIEN